MRIPLESVTKIWTNEHLRQRLNQISKFARQKQITLIQFNAMKNPQFGSLIKEYRTAKGWTQLELAQALGYENAQFISLMENNNSKCPLKVLGQLVVLLGIPEGKIIETLKAHYAESVQTQIDEGKKIAAGGGRMESDKW